MTTDVRSSQAAAEGSAEDELRRAILANEAALAELRVPQALAPLLRISLTTAQLRALVLLAMEGEMSAHAFAAALGIRAASASSLLERLEQTGMVTRRVDIADRRVRLVAATERASAALRELLQPSVRELLEHLDHDELEALDTGIAALLCAARTAPDPTRGTGTPARAAHAFPAEQIVPMSSPAPRDVP